MNARLLQLIMLFITFNLIQAEYVLFKTNPNMFTGIEPLPKADYEMIYRSILMKYQWPMSIAARIDGAKTISFALPGLYPFEEEFIRKKLKAINPSYDLIFIPTSYYELFALKAFAKSAFEGKIKEEYNDCIENVYKAYFNQYDLKHDLDALVSVIMSKKNSLSVVYELFNTINSTPCMLNLYKLMNDFFIHNFELISETFEYNESLKLAIDDDEIKKLMSALSQIYERKTKKYVSAQIFKSIDMEKMYFYELDMHQHNLGILYRGVEPLVATSFFGKNILPLEYTTYLTMYNFGTVKSQDKSLKEQDIEFFKRYIELLKKPKDLLTVQENDEIKNAQQLFDEDYRYFEWLDPLRSVSFGNSLMAGYLKDSGACVAEFLYRNAAIGYGLSINKYLYMKGDLQSLFRISPLSTLIALFSATGELFHSRSISAYGQGHELKLQIAGVAAAGISKDEINYVAQQTNPLRKSLDLATYIERNATILKLSSKLGGWRFNELDAKEYMQDQSYLVKVLTILNAVQDSIEAKKARSDFKRKRSEDQFDINKKSKHY